MSEDISKRVCEFVDYLMPELTPYESALYLLLLRVSSLMSTFGRSELANVRLPSVSARVQGQRLR